MMAHEKKPLPLTLGAELEELVSILFEEVHEKPFVLAIQLSSRAMQGGN